MVKLDHHCDCWVLMFLKICTLIYTVNVHLHTRTHVVLTDISQANLVSSIADCSLHNLTRRFGAKFYWPDAIPDAGQQTYTLASPLPHPLWLLEVGTTPFYVVCMTQVSLCNFLFAVTKTYRCLTDDVYFIMLSMICRSRELIVICQLHWIAAKCCTA